MGAAAQHPAGVLKGGGGPAQPHKAAAVFPGRPVRPGVAQLHGALQAQAVQPRLGQQRVLPQAGGGAGGVLAAGLQCLEPRQRVGADAPQPGQLLGKGAVAGGPAQPRHRAPRPPGQPGGGRRAAGADHQLLAGALVGPGAKGRGVLGPGFQAGAQVVQLAGLQRPAVRRAVVGVQVGGAVDVHVGVHVPPQGGQHVQRVDVGLYAAGAHQPHGPRALLKGVAQFLRGLLHGGGAHGQAVAGQPVADRCMEIHPLPPGAARPGQPWRAGVCLALPGRCKLAVAVVWPQADDVVGQVQHAGLGQGGQPAVHLDADGRGRQHGAHLVQLGAQHPADLFPLAGQRRGGQVGQDAPALFRQADAPDQLLVFVLLHRGGPQRFVGVGTVGIQDRPAGPAAVKGHALQRQAGGRQPPQAHGPGQVGGGAGGQRGKVAAQAQQRLQGHLPVQVLCAGVPAFQQLAARKAPAPQPHRGGPGCVMFGGDGGQLPLFKPLVVPEPQRQDAQRGAADVQQRIHRGQVVGGADDHRVGALQVDDKLFRRQLARQHQRDAPGRDQVAGVQRHFQVAVKAGQGAAQRFAGPLGADLDPAGQQKFHGSISSSRYARHFPPRRAGAQGAHACGMLSL